MPKLSTRERVFDEKTTKPEYITDLLHLFQSSPLDTVQHEQKQAYFERTHTLCIEMAFFCHLYIHFSLLCVGLMKKRANALHKRIRPFYYLFSISRIDG